MKIWCLLVPKSSLASWKTWWTAPTWISSSMPVMQGSAVRWLKRKKRPHLVKKANAVVRLCIEIQWTAALAFGDQIMPCPTSRQISCYLGLFDVAIKFLWFKTQSKTQWILLFLTLGFPTRNSIQVQRQQSILSRCYKRGCPSCSQAQRLHHPDKLLL